MPDYSNSEMRHIIDEYVRNPRYRSLLYLRYCEGATYDEIAERINYSPQHVKHICRTYRDRLISHL